VELTGAFLPLAFGAGASASYSSTAAASVYSVSTAASY